jgi:hypothetical protein
MAREPLVVCGSKSIRFSNLHWGIVSARYLPHGANETNFYDVFNSVVCAYWFWLKIFVLTWATDVPVRRWILGQSITDNSDIRNRVLDFLEVRGHTLSAGFFVSFVLALLLRFQYGLAPLRSWWLLLPILSSIATLLLTPIPSDGERVSKSIHENLVWVLNMTRFRQATREVDRVFALCGLFSEIAIPLDKPDYKKPVGKVYLEFTRAVIKWLDSVGILVEASAPWMQDSPSWVPDWSRPQYRIFRRHSMATGNSSSTFSFSTCGLKLSVSSRIADTVVLNSEPLQELSDGLSSGVGASLPSAQLSPFIHNVKVMMRWMSHSFQHPNRTYDSVSDALFETIHSETDFEVMDRDELRRVFDHWVSVLKADYSNCNSLCPGEVACALAISMNESLHRYHRQRCYAIAGRKIFFVTSKGYIGAGPPSMSISDRLALVSGVNIPMILRGRDRIIRLSDQLMFMV